MASALAVFLAALFLKKEGLRKAMTVILGVLGVIGIIYVSVY